MRSSQPHTKPAQFSHLRSTVSLAVWEVQLLSFLPRLAKGWSLSKDLVFLPLFLLSLERRNTFVCSTGCQWNPWRLPSVQRWIKTARVRPPRGPNLSTGNDDHFCLNVSYQ